MSTRDLERHLERNAFLAVFFDVLGRWSLGAALILGPAWLLCRWQGWIDPDLFGAPVGYALAFLPLAIGAVIAWRAAGKQRLAPGTALAWIDRRLGGDGRLLTAAERPDPRWEARARSLVEEAEVTRALRLPRSRTDRPVFFSLAALGLSFFAIAAKLPEPFVPSAELFTDWIERLADRIDSLDELELDEETAERMTDELERLREKIEEAPPEAMYEALDRLDEELDREAQKLAAQKARMDAELAEAMDAARSFMDDAGSEGSEADAQAALESLSAALADAELGKWLDEKSLDELAGQLAKLNLGKFDGEMAARMGESMRDGLEQRFSELAKSGAFKPGRLRELAEKFGGT